MDGSLAGFLARHTPFHEETAIWWWGQMHVRLTSYLSDELPPRDLITSASTLLFRDDAVIVSRNRDDTHILPGGRREPGETLMQTLSREVMEETGWTICDVALLGFVHGRHETPKPENYPYPYPDFIRVVYMADADTFTVGTTDPDEYELESAFRSIADVRSMTLRNGQHGYLDHALALRDAKE